MEPSARSSRAATCMPEALVTETRDVNGTIAFGTCLGSILRAGDVVAMYGDLGAGKTVLAKGIACGLGISDPRRVTSPTFVIVNEYDARLHIYHVDAYRLHGPRELELIGFEEMLDAGGVVLIEWAERLEPLLPPGHFRVHLEPAGPTSRRITVAAPEQRLADLRAALSAAGLPAR